MAETIAQRTARIRRERRTAEEAKRKQQTAKPAASAAGATPPATAKKTPTVQFQDPDKTPWNPQGMPDPVNEGKRKSGIEAKGATKKSDEQAETWAHQKEMQDQGHKHQLELQQKSQDFQREQADRADAQWYARQEYLRGQKNRSVKWTFRARSNGTSSRSRWDINIQKFGEDPGRPGSVRSGRIGVPARGPNGRSQLQMNGPALAPNDGGIGVQNGVEANRPADSADLQGAVRGTGRADRMKGFAFEVKPTTVAEDVANANKGLKPEDRDPLLRTKDRNGITYEQKLNMLAEATATGAKVSIAHNAVDAAGKPMVGSEYNTTIHAEGTRGEIGFFGKDGSGVNVTNGGRGFAGALEAQEQIQGREKGSLGSTSSRVAEVDRAQHQQALAKAGVTPSFRLSDFKQRKQGRDGRYYDA